MRLQGACIGTSIHRSARVRVRAKKRASEKQTAVILERVVSCMHLDVKMIVVSCHGMHSGYASVVEEHLRDHAGGAETFDQPGGSFATIVGAAVPHRHLLAILAKRAYVHLQAVAVAPVRAEHAAIRQADVSDTKPAGSSMAHRRPAPNRKFSRLGWQYWPAPLPGVP
jgi:hypothetical protein